MARLEVESQGIKQNEGSPFRRGRHFGQSRAIIDPAIVKLARESKVANFMHLPPDMRTIIWRRYIQSYEEPPTLQQLGEQDFQRGPKNKLTRSAVQSKEQRGIRRLKRLRGLGGSSYELSSLELRRIAKQEIVRKAEQENILINLTFREQEVLRLIYLNEGGVVVPINQVAQRLGIKPKSAIDYKYWGLKKIKQAQEQNGEVLMRQSRRVKYKMHQDIVNEAFERGLFDVLTERERIVLEVCYLTLTESNTLPVEKASSILGRSERTIKAQEYTGRIKLEAELQKL